MGNRTMQAKALKLQRQLRKMPRRIDNPPGEFTKHSATEMPARLKAEGVSVPRSPNRELMSGYKHRAKSLGMEEADTRYLGIPPGRVEARERAKALREEEVDPSITKLLRYVKCRL